MGQGRDDSRSVLYKNNWIDGSAASQFSRFTRFN